MPLLETLAVGVGTGVAKGVLKVWFKEDPISAGVGNSLLDFLKSRSSDALDAKKAEKQFQQIAKKVAASIHEVVTTRYPNISDERKDVIAGAAGTTLNTTEYTADLLVKANLAPEELSELFLAKSGAEGGNPKFVGQGESPAPREEQDLYRMILSEASQLIIDTASQYPNYNTEVFSALLVGQDEHVKKLDLIVDELKRLRTGGADEEDLAYREFEEKYRRAVVRRLDELQLFGVDLANATKRYKLSTAYVSLLVEREALLDEIASNSKLTTPQEDDDEEDTTESVKVDEALAQTSRLFIRGAPGSGKTTLLQWVAVMSASKSLENELAGWNEFVPFFVRLRDFADRDLPSPDAFAGLINRVLEAPRGWERHQLQNGRAIVLIDGLDELAADRMEEVRRWLDDLANEFGQARYVLSSRPHAAEERWLAPVGFLDAELQDMSSDDIDSFIDHWHDAAREGLKDPGALKELDELQVALKQRLQKSVPIRRLVTSPLLCAVVCALHRDRMRNIPDDRIELYEACIDMFLRRDHERRIELPQYPNLTSRQIKSLLSDLAYWYLRNGLSMANAVDVDERLEKKLADFKDIPAGTTGREVRKGFVARSGILREPSAEKIDFPHRTFQEFLAAKEIVEERDFGLLAEQADDQQNWRETIILAAGLANQKEAQELIKSLVTRFDKEGDAGFLLLAVGCLETVVSLSDEVQKAVESRLHKVLPPSNMTTAKELAKAGDLVVPHLQYRKMTGAQAAASVRALSEIRTAIAWRTAAAYCDDRRLATWKAIVAAAGRSPEYFAIVKKHPNAPTVHISMEGAVLLAMGRRTMATGGMVTAPLRRGLLYAWYKGHDGNNITSIQVQNDECNTWIRPI